MCDNDKGPSHTAMDRLRARQQQLATLRADLLSGEEDRRTAGLKQLYLELATSGDLWFDRLGHVARVDGEAGFEAGLVELILCMLSDDWPAEPETAEDDD